MLFQCVTSCLLCDEFGWTDGHPTEIEALHISFRRVWTAGAAVEQICNAAEPVEVKHMVTGLQKPTKYKHVKYFISKVVAFCVIVFMINEKWMLFFVK